MLCGLQTFDSSCFTSRNDDNSVSDLYTARVKHTGHSYTSAHCFEHVRNTQTQRLVKNWTQGRPKLIYNIQMLATIPGSLSLVAQVD